MLEGALVACRLAIAASLRILAVNVKVEGGFCESYGGRHHINLGACGGNSREIEFGGGYCRCICLAEDLARGL